LHGKFPDGIGPEGVNEPVTRKGPPGPPVTGFQTKKKKISAQPGKGPEWLH
jgi:hypothetical protein